ncbi:MAG: NADPH-dependent FMN reductase [Gemmatimonadaceae bacterium]
MTTFRILAISGSLRARSSNTELLKAAALVAAPGTVVGLFDGIGALPHFNPDVDAEGAILPVEVERLRSAIAASDALLISSPEYAHGVPGSLKNALDWLVSGPEMVEKPVALLNASSRSTHAHLSLAETLRTMSAALVPGADDVVALDARKLDAAEIAADRELAGALRRALRALEDFARAGTS